MPRLLNHANFVLRSSTQLVMYYFIQNFHVQPYVHFLSSVELKHWLVILSLINTDGSIPALKTLPSKVFYQTLARPEGSGVQTLPCTTMQKGLGSRQGTRRQNYNSSYIFSSLQDAARVCQGFMARDPSELHFTVVALAAAQ